MRRIGLAVATLITGWSASLGAAVAVCTPAAPGPALATFIKDPAGWIATYGKSPELASSSLVIAAAAVNVNDPNYGKALSMMLGAASSDQGRIIGHALSALEGSCSDLKDPADIADKKYISLNILPNLLSNLSANVAYGEGSGPESTSTGGGGGGGNGLVGSGLPDGGANSGSASDGSTATATAGDPIADLSAGAIGSTLAGQLLTTNELTTPATISTTPGGTASGAVSANQ